MYYVPYIVFVPPFFISECEICTGCINNVAATVDSAKQVTVTWDAPTMFCPGDQFEIVATPINIDMCNDNDITSSDIITEIISSQVQNSKEITGLKPNTDYIITVTSRLADSDDGQSVSVSATTKIDSKLIKFDLKSKHSFFSL